MTNIDAKTLVAAVAVAALLLPLGSAGDASPAANKAAAAAGGVVLLGDAATPLPPTPILQTDFKAGGPQDAVIELTLECSLLTDVYSTTIDNHPEGYTAVGEADAHVVVWVEVDGQRVNVGADDGAVTFCDRVHQQEIRDIDDSTGNFTIRQFQQTMSANAFNWVVLDLGSGVHHIVAWATITAGNTQGSYAQGAIAKRTLVVDPVDFAHGATLDDGSTSSPGASSAAAPSSADAAAEPSSPVPDVTPLLPPLA